MGCVVTLCSQIRAHQPADLSESGVLIEQLPQFIAKGRPDLIMAAMGRHSPDNYLYAHAVNVAVLAAFIAVGLGHRDAAVQQIALAGLVCDLGMAGPTEALIQLPRPLVDDERRTVQQHAAASAALFQNSLLLSQEAREAVVLHHERLDGSGYPGGLRDAAVPEFARILAAADTFDAMTHPRAYRRKLSPAQSLKLMIDGSDKQFDRRAVKVLVDELSLYPPGSTVRLNTNETGIVHRVHKQAPLRPLVMIFRDANGNALPTSRAVNLLEHPFIYVKEIVPDIE